MSTPQLTRSEQARVDAYTELQAAKRAGEFVHEYQLEEAKHLADQARMNAEARAKHQAKLAAEKQAQADQHAAAVQQRQQAEIEAHKRQARAAFPGTDAQFDDAWPQILKRWQTEHALAAMRGVEDDARSRVRGLL